MPQRLRRLRRAELPVDTAELARYLIGKTLVHDTPAGRMSGRIVETEAYVPGDASGHAFHGRTARNNSLFLDRGHAYVYFIYGNWFSLNVSGETPGVGGGALIRAVEPLEGLALMREFRGDVADHALLRGPGCVATGMDLNRRYDGIDLCAANPLWLGTAQKPVSKIGASVRIGISKEIHRPLRFFEVDNPCVSGPKHLSRTAVLHA